MLNIGVTGARGLIGHHTRVFLHSLGTETVQCRPADRSTFESDEALENFVDGLDAIIHLAGMNRGSDEEILELNPGLARRLTAACDARTVRPHIVFSSSTHIDRDTAYGESKRRTGDHFATWSRTHGARFANLVLPHVFGEGGRPDYNSVVSTFCHRLANDGAAEIQSDGDVELFHAQRVAELAWDVIREGREGTLRPEGTPMKVSELLRRLTLIKEQYSGHLIPDLSEPIDLDLFNTYRSYLYPSRYPRELKLNTDDRGHLFEGVRTLHGGQCFVSTTKPGITRGNHYHRRKFERFLVVSGEAEICIRPMFSDQVTCFPVTGDKPVYVDMPTLHTHNITNTGDDPLVTLFWAHELFDPDHPDTFWETV
ncbi:MAG: NAD-dependent epimerase/dehydratase family protein [Gammaproteobacteria bacterium]